MKNKTSILSLVLIIGVASSWAQKNPCNPTGLPYTSLPGDTTVILPHGTRLTFNRCEYFDIRDCLDLTEAYDIESMRRQNLTTLDQNGNVLLSAGMFCMKLTGDCDAKPCFEVPVKIAMPLPNPSGNNCGRCQRGTFRLYNSSTGIWSDSSNNNFKITEINGQTWIEFTAPCANICFNADCCMDLHAGKTKVKVKNIGKLESVEMTIECPVGVLKYFPKKGRKKVIARLPCFESSTIKISAKGEDKAGNIVSSPEQPIRELKHSRGKRKCEADKMGKKTREGRFYKKYIIRIPG